MAKFKATIEGEVPDGRRKWLNRLLVDIGEHISKAIGGDKAVLRLEYDEKEISR